MMGGDFCVNPNEYSLQVVNGEDIHYYVNCQTPYPGFYEQVTEMLEEMANAGESVDSVRTNVTVVTHILMLA